jgi:hypothetical protein
LRGGLIYPSSAQNRNAQGGLHRHPFARRGDVARRETGQQVTLLGEPGVGAEFVPLAQVELPGPLAEPDRGRRPALHPDDAGRPAARTLAKQALLHQHNPGQPGPAQEVSAPRAHRPAADHHRVRGAFNDAHGPTVLIGTPSMLA